MTIDEMQAHVEELKEAQGWTEKSPIERSMWLTAEVGELVKEVLRFSAATTEHEQDEVRRDLGREMYDVVWNLCDLANLVGVRLEDAFADKIAINRTRTW